MAARNINMLRKYIGISIPKTNNVLLGIYLTQLFIYHFHFHKFIMSVPDHVLKKCT